MNFNEIQQLTPFRGTGGEYALRYLKSHIEDWQNIKYGANLELCPDFQRGYVWTKEQQIAYLEYSLKGGTQNPIYFNSNHETQSDSTKWHFYCVDGLQRLTALLGFLNNEIPAFGYLYHEFEGVLSVTVPIYTNNLKTRAEVLKWYIELNSGGTVHTKEELERVESLLLEEKG